MSYFITKKDLDQEREYLFTAISKVISDLRSEILLILNSLGYETQRANTKHNGEKYMYGITELIGRLKEIALEEENTELQDIASALEKAVRKDGQKWRRFREELDQLQVRIEEVKKEREEAEKKAENKNS